MYKYLLNGFLFLIPIFIWNLVFVKSLPIGFSKDIFWKDIPKILGTTENVLRIIVFILPLIMSISLDTKQQKIGLWIYFLGIVIYFLSWLLQLYYPESVWSKSVLGFMAPAYTTIIWFVGIGLIGQENFLRIPYFSLIYYSTVSLFVFFHTFHAYIVFNRL